MIPEKREKNGFDPVVVIVVAAVVVVVVVVVAPVSSDFPALVGSQHIRRKSAKMSIFRIRALKIMNEK